MTDALTNKQASIIDEVGLDNSAAPQVEDGDEQGGGGEEGVGGGGRKLNYLQKFGSFQR